MKRGRSEKRVLPPWRGGSLIVLLTLVRSAVSTPRGQFCAARSSGNHLSEKRLRRPFPLYRAAQSLSHSSGTPFRASVARPPPQASPKP